MSRQPIGARQNGESSEIGKSNTSENTLIIQIVIQKLSVVAKSVQNQKRAPRIDFCGRKRIVAFL
jgi:hypothetical protein